MAFPPSSLQSSTAYVLPLIFTLAGQSLTSLASQAIPVVAVEAARSFGLDKDLVGFFISSTYLVAMLSALAGGTYALRHGAVLVQQICLILCMAGLLLFAIGSVWILPLAALLIGMGYGPATPASSQILARVTPLHLSNLVFSIKQTGVPLGGILAGALIARLVAPIGWQGALLSAAGLCAILAVALEPMRRRYDTDIVQSRMPSVRELLQPLLSVIAMPAIRRLALISVSFSAVQVSLSTFLVLYLVDRLGFSLESAGLVLAATLLAGVVGRVLWGAVADYSRRPRLLLGLLALVMAGSAVLMTLVSPAWPLGALLALCCVFGGSAIGWNGVYLAEVAKAAPPGAAGVITGGVSFFTFSGPLIGPSLFSAILWISGSYALGFCAMAVLTLTSGIFLLRDVWGGMR